MAAGQATAANKVPEIRTGDTVVVTGTARMPASAARSSVSCETRSASHTAAASTGGRRPSRPRAVVVSGINIAKRHTKPRQTPELQTTGRRKIQQGGIVDKPSRIDAEQRDDRLPALRPSHPSQARAPRQRPARSRVPPLRRAAGGGRMSGRLQERYTDEAVPALHQAVRATPTRCRSRGSRRSSSTSVSARRCTNAKAIDAAVGDLGAITGQKPIVTKAKRSIAQFRLRTGNTIGAKVTLRGERMWDFLERLTRARPAPHPRLPRRPGQVVRRPRQLLARTSRAARVPGDRLRQGGPSPRAGDQHRDDGEDRRGIEAFARTPRHALRRLGAGRRPWPRSR